MVGRTAFYWEVCRRHGAVHFYERGNMLENREQLFDFLNQCSQDELLDLCHSWDQPQYFTTVLGTEVEEKNGRWDLFNEVVVEHIPTNTFIKFQWFTGATEYQEVEPNVTWFQVEPVEKTVTVYKKVKA